MMLDAQELKRFRRITKIVAQLQLQYAGIAIIINTYNTRYYDDKPNHPVQVINIYIYVGNHMATLELPPTSELENRLPGIIEAVINALSIESE